MSLTLEKTDNKLILQRRKRRKIKKVFMLFILLISVCITLCFKLSYFDIKTIQVTGNKNILSKEIIGLSNLYKGNNIFYINIKYGENSILSNPYIENVEISRKLPDKVQINVKEREAIFYNVKNNKYFVVDKSGILLEKRNDIKGMKLIKLDGFDYDKCEIGKTLVNNDKTKIDVVSALSNIILNSKSTIAITSIDISDILNIKVYCGEVCIKIGTSDDMDKKINKSLNILDRKELKGVKGYIDVSFNGNPVFFIQK